MRTVTKGLSPTQQVREKTRLRSDQQPSPLDLVVTNESNDHHGLCFHTLLGKSDQVIVNFAFQLRQDIVYEKLRGDFGKLDMRN